MKFSVGYVNFFDNELIIEVVEASNVKDALLKHSKLSDPDTAEWVATMPDDLEAIKAAFFEGEILIEVVPCSS